MNTLKNKVVIVTGGNSGIGYATAKEFISKGASVIITGRRKEAIENAAVDNFDTVMNINFRGAYFTLSRFIPLLNDGASVIILSSIVASTHKPNSSIYQASKAALNSIAKTAAAELAPRNIRVNIVSPGPHKTEIMNKAGLDETTLRHIKESLIGQIPLKKMGEATDVGKIVVSLCNDSFNFTTGAEIVIDGGMTL